MLTKSPKYHLYSVDWAKTNVTKKKVQMKNGSRLIFGPSWLRTHRLWCQILFNIWVQLYIFVLNIYYIFMIFLYIYYKFMIFLSNCSIYGTNMWPDGASRKLTEMKISDFLYRQSLSSIFFKADNFIFLVCQIHWNNYEQVWNLGFHRKAWRKAGFLLFLTNWHLFKVTPPCRWDNTKERKLRNSISRKANH